MSLKINDLRRLKKCELLDLVNKYSVTQPPHKVRKEQLIELLLCANPPDSDSSSRTQAHSKGIDLPVPVNYPELSFQVLTDQLLNIVPTCSFMQLYSYCCGGDAESMKSLDRAVKHASAGDVSDLQICQVCKSLYHIETILYI